MSDDLLTPKKPIEQPVKEKFPEKEKKFERENYISFAVSAGGSREVRRKVKREKQVINEEEETLKVELTGTRTINLTEYFNEVPSLLDLNAYEAVEANFSDESSVSLETGDEYDPQEPNSYDTLKQQQKRVEAEKLLNNLMERKEAPRVFFFF